MRQNTIIRIQKNLAKSIEKIGIVSFPPPQDYNPSSLKRLPSLTSINAGHSSETTSKPQRQQYLKVHMQQIL
jgi:hypothetical protein